MCEVKEIKKVLNDYGYSLKAVSEILKWFELCEGF